MEKSRQSILLTYYSELFYVCMKRECERATRKKEEEASAREHEIKSEDIRWISTVFFVLVYYIIV